MKHTIITLLLLVAAGSVCQGQTFDEWFKQKKTQKKYLLQQIAALQMYAGYVKKGYGIAQKGLTTISDIKSGEFNLHQEYFSSLKNVNPKIRNYAEVAGIISLEVKITQLYLKTNKQVQVSNLFNDGDVKYVFKVFSNLMDDCAATITELTALITNNNWEMKDNERLGRMDALCRNMQDNFTFAQSFSDQTKMLALQRMKEKNDVQTGLILNGLHNK